MVEMKHPPTLAPLAAPRGAGHCRLLAPFTRGQQYASAAIHARARALRAWASPRSHGRLGTALRDWRRGLVRFSWVAAIAGNMAEREVRSARSYSSAAPFFRASPRAARARCAGDPRTQL